MDTVSAARLAQALLQKHGLHSMGWRFAFNRGQRQLGLCRFHDKRIELSLHYCLRHNEPEIRDTLLHEIAHAIAGPEAGHGPKWKAACLHIGAKPHRLAASANLPQAPWRATCQGCQQSFDRFRRPSISARYHCPDCGPVRGALHFEKVKTASRSAQKPPTP
jgi:predicted SprT family Zn-dependent metalloprotease